MPEAPLPGQPAMLEARDVHRAFDVSRPALQRLFSREGRRTLKAVDGVSFAIARGSTLSLVGESGCGKSTVARLAVGIYPPSSGAIRFEGEDIADARAQPGMRRRMNMIFQDPYASLNPRWRVRDIVAEPIRT
ncbi:MAG: ATP-binding cassette domain-containing protein, partial [Acetobacteraceae bacterium]|nr:ATP-binding cassette domain-containing protein [Acetobacteraceae bacterium]